MKYYGMRKNRNTDYILLKSLKLSRKLEYLTEIDKDKKKRKEEIYRNEFLGNPRFEKSNQIPKYFSYEPVVTIATDLVAKENINQLKHGLKKIILKYYTKELFGTVARYCTPFQESVVQYFYSSGWITILWGVIINVFYPIIAEFLGFGKYSITFFDFRNIRKYLYSSI